MRRSSSLFREVAGFERSVGGATSSRPPSGDRPLREYAVIGDGRTAALVAPDGSIDWCCLPRFDGDPVLCRLLDARRGGFLRVAPARGAPVGRRYLPETNVLETEFATERGRMRLTDFLPLGGAGGPAGSPRIVRRIEALGGPVEVEIDCRVTGEYGRVRPDAVGRTEVSFGEEDDAIVLAAPVEPSRVERNRVRGTLRLREGERAWVSLGAGARRIGDGDAERALEETIRAWRSWLEPTCFDGPHASLVRRSALVLKLLVYEPTGALVAAPTTSLPERAPGQTWDYRYAWIRDSGLVFDVLQTLGHHRESLRFFEWIEALSRRPSGTIGIVEPVDGEGSLEEREARHLAGWRGARPVRIGNAAAEQLQLDVAGHVIETAHLCHERMPRALEPGLATLLPRLADHAAERWAEPDAGPWEIRRDPRHHLYSKLYCWVALDRAIAMAMRHGLVGGVDRWRRAWQELRRAILEAGVDSRTGTFRDAFGDDVPGAAALLMPRIGFLAGDDGRLRRTVDRLCRERSDGVFLRRHRPGIAIEDEGGFVPSSFWLVEALAAAGAIEEAHERFEGIVRAASDLGLLSEEVDASSGELLGNYPQAFSHLELVRAARALESAEGRRRGSIGVGARQPKSLVLRSTPQRTSQSHRP